MRAFMNKACTKLTLCIMFTTVVALVQHTPAYSQESLIVHSLSVHTKSNNVYNNQNFGAGYRWGSGVSVGAYYNSYRKPTTYAAYEKLYPVGMGFMIGVATGYEKATGNKVSPLGGFILDAGQVGNSKAYLLVVPPVGSTAGVVHLRFVLN